MMDSLIQKAFADMDPKTGMFPEDWPCLKCGKQLNADGGHPAELYAGTFTGLCYGCTASTGYVTHVLALDGCQVWSYPPSSPSWRRDRENEYGYPDCKVCGGTGRTSRRRLDQRPPKCPVCWCRFLDEPKRKNTDALGRLIAQAAQSVFQKRLDAEATAGMKIKGKKARQEIIATWCQECPERVEKIRSETMQRYRFASTRLAHLKDHWGVWKEISESA